MTVPIFCANSVPLIRCAARISPESVTAFAASASRAYISESVVVGSNMQYIRYLGRDNDNLARELGLLADLELIAPPGRATSGRRVIPKNVNIAGFDEIPNFCLPLIEQCNGGDDDSDAVFRYHGVRKISWQDWRLADVCYSKMCPLLPNTPQAQAYGPGTAYISPMSNAA